MLKIAGVLGTVDNCTKGIVTTFKLGMQILILNRLIFLPMFKRYMKKKMFNKKESHLLGLSFLYMSVKFQNIHSEGCRSPLKDLFWSQASILETTALMIYPPQRAISASYVPGCSFPCVNRRVGLKLSFGGVIWGHRFSQVAEVRHCGSCQEMWNERPLRRASLLT